MEDISRRHAVKLAAGGVAAVVGAQALLGAEDKKEETAQMRMARHGGAVRLTMSAKVANDIGALEKGLRSLAERLGHRSCFTGCDIMHLQMEQEFTINQEVQLNPQPLPPKEIVDSNPMPGRTVTVSIPPKVSGNIESLQKAIAATLTKLGCAPCSSGFDILFKHEWDMIHINEKLEAQGFGAYR